MNNLAIAQIETQTAIPAMPMAMVNRLALASALKTVCTSIDQRFTIPILSHVHMKACDNSLQIVGTDLDVTTKVTIPGVADNEFDVTLPAHSLLKLIAKAAADTVTLTIQEMTRTETIHDPATEYSEAATRTVSHSGKVLIDLGTAQLTLNSLPVADYPEMKTQFETPAECSTFSLAAPVLVEAFTKTSYAMSTEETRYYLQGIYLHFHRSDIMGLSGLMAVATDGHQLVARSIAALVPTNMPGVIVPGKTVLNVIKTLGKSKETVKVALSTSNIRFAFGDTVIMSKLIDGTFPDYERVIPRQNGTKWEIGKKALCAAIDQVMPVSREKGRAVKVEFENGTARLTVNNSDVGNCTATIPAQHLAGDESFTVGLNAKYLLNAANCVGETLEFSLADAGSPVIIRDAMDPRGFQIIMPMRT